MKNTNKNFIYNVIYQIFIFIIPLITTPYISRVLGVDNVGIYSYTYSLVNYFMLCSLIGINNYGARNIAKKSSNKDEMSEEFSNIYFLQLFLTIIMLILYFIFSLFISKYNIKIMLIQSIFLVSVAFDINWLYFGMEKFKITISRNIIIKLLSLVLIFCIVKNSGDLWKYTLIMSCSTLISQLYLWIFIKKYIDFHKPSFKKILKNLKPCLVLFIPVIAYSIYRIMDKTMIGYIANTIELGNYESAEKIINIPISLITALGTVMLPHMSKASDKEIKNKITDTYRLIFLFTIPMCFGIFAISSDFSTVFFGNEFTLTAGIIKLLIITVIFSAIANVIRTNYLIPKEKDNIYVTSTILGAIINLILNIIFIKKYGAYGACIGTICAEFTVMIYQVIKTINIIDYKQMICILFNYTIKSFIMVSIIYLLGHFIGNIYLKLALQIITAIIVYFILNYKYIIYDFLGKKAKI